LALMKYKISKEALEDLEQIWYYTFETWSIEQADRYFNLIMNEIEFLSEHWGAGKDYSHVRQGYFRSRAKYHFIFYKIDIKSGVIEIIRILHQRMDIEEQLND
jgi:toxin ParE1/3/4